MLFNFQVIIIRPQRDSDSLSVRWLIKILSLGIYAVTSLFSLKFISNEIEQMKKKKMKYYWREIWNYFDLFAYFFPFLVAVLDFISIIDSDIIDPFDLFIRFFASLGVFCVWIKLLTFTRGFKNFAYLLRMIHQCIIKQRFFFIVTFCSVIAFASASNLLIIHSYIKYLLYFLIV